MTKMITVEERIRRCLLIEKMEKEKEYCKKLEIENKSTLCGITKPDHIKAE